MYKIKPDNYFKTDSQPFAIHRTTPEVNETEHDHEFEELVIVERGSAIHILNGQSTFIQTGDVFYVSINDYHYYNKINNLCLTNILVRPEVAFTIIPPLDQILRIGFDYLPSQHLHLGVRERDIFFDLLRDLTSNEGATDSREKIRCESTLLKIISLIEKKSNLIIGNKNISAVETMLETIRDFPCQDIEWEKLCQTYGMSHRTLFRQVKSLTGYTPEKYLQAMRLRNAKELITTGNMTISEIAIHSGFKNFSHFSRCYKERYGVTPSEERRLSQW